MYQRMLKYIYFAIYPGKVTLSTKNQEVTNSSSYAIMRKNGGVI